MNEYENESTQMLALRIRSLRTLLTKFVYDKEHEQIIRTQINKVKKELIVRRDELTKIIEGNEEFLDG